MREGKEFFNGIGEKELMEIHSKLHTMYDDGDMKTFGLVYENGTGLTQLIRLVDDDGKESNHVSIESHDGKVNHQFLWSDDMLRGLMLLLGFYLDGKTIAKPIKIVPTEKDSDIGKMEGIGTLCANMEEK